MKSNLSKNNITTIQNINEWKILMEEFLIKSVRIIINERTFYNKNINEKNKKNGKNENSIKNNVKFYLIFI